MPEGCAQDQGLVMQGTPQNMKSWPCWGQGGCWGRYPWVYHFNDRQTQPFSEELKQVRQKSHANTGTASPISKKQLLLWYVLVKRAR